MSVSIRSVSSLDISVVLWWFGQLRKRICAICCAKVDIQSLPIVSAGKVYTVVVLSLGVLYDPGIPPKRTTTEEIAEVLSNVMRSRNNVVEVKYVLGKYIELTTQD